MKTGCLIYGANGYTGRLIAQRAVDCRLSPILAGRDAHGVRRMAGSLKCAARVFSLSDHATIVRNVRDVRAVLNCAGPFAATAEPMMEACLETGTHYLDITGEIDVIEAAASRGPRADNAGVVLLPAVGFDVVPGDCLAGLLSRKRPAARLLELAIDVRGGVSPGTAATVWTQARHGGRIRRGGRVERVPHAWRMIDVPFPHRRSVALSVPWGDVAAAFHSTGIPNIVVYAAVSPSVSRLIPLGRGLAHLTRVPTISHLGQWFLQRCINGPDEHRLLESHSYIWGRVTDQAGASAAATLTLPNAYALTSLTAVDSLAHVLRADGVSGFLTPAMLLQPEFILSYDDVRCEHLNPVVIS